MKKTIFLFTFLLGINLSSYCQHGFTSNSSGQLDKIDLTDATFTNVGNTITFSGTDFDNLGNLYGIGQFDNKLYLVDTTDASTTYIADVVPPAGHDWTGMAFDYSSTTMYLISGFGIEFGNSELYTIDLSNGTISLIGSISNETFSSIAFNDITGQLYGMTLSLLESAKLYEISTTDASITLVGIIGGNTSGNNNGMDYCRSDSTMYATTYNSFNVQSSLFTVDLTTGLFSQVGSPFTVLIPTIAIPSFFSVSFSSDVTEVCVGGTVNFINLSTNATSYSWTFEGGTPATSTDENPSVVYNTPGTYDVSLTASNSNSSDTFTITDMITVNDIPAQPNTPTGDTQACSGSQIDYSTNEVLYADSYIWEVDPATAGSITDNSNTVVFYSSDTYSGDYTIKVQATNACGTGIWSAELACALNESPNEYSLSEGGDACEGGDGVEITLSGSETGVDYYLHYAGDTAAGPIAGTGDVLSFGFFTGDGYYSATAYNGYCNVFMIGDAVITIANLPPAAETPSGPESICAETTSDYTVEEVEGASSYVWTISPAEAGTIEGETIDATVTWNADYEGIAEIAARAENECGAGPSGPSLEVMVYTEPNPVIAGDELVCQFDYGIYTVDFSEYSDYSWTVDGGNIVDGEGTNEITVYWTAEQGSTTYVDVTESKTDACEATAETFEVTIDDCVGIEENFVERFEVYPNPAKNQVTVQLKDITNGFVDLQLIDSKGKIVLTQNQLVINNSYYSNINISYLNNGLYLMIVKLNNTVYSSRKLVLIK